MIEFNKTKSKKGALIEAFFTTDYLFTPAQGQQQV